MKLYVRGLFACAVVLAGLVFTGCRSSSDGPTFLSSPQNPNSAGLSVAGQPGTAPPAATNVAHFHVGDTVTISFSGSLNPIPDHVEAIKEDGTINLDYIGKVDAVGKTAGELQSDIHNAYVPKYYKHLTVTVASGQRFFYVGGEIKAASGRQAYTDGLTVTKAIQTAGGLTDFANHKKVYLVRATTGKRIQVNYDDALKDPAKDPPVYPDDQIIVEKRIF